MTDNLRRDIEALISALNNLHANDDLRSSHYSTLHDMVSALANHPATDDLASAWDKGFDAGYDKVLVERASQIGALNLRCNPYRTETGEDQ